MTEALTIVLHVLCGVPIGMILGVIIWERIVRNIERLLRSLDDIDYSGGY